MAENIIVLLAVTAAAAYTISKISRSIKGKGMACGCGSEKLCKGCMDSMPDCPGGSNKHSCEGSDC